MNRKIFTIIIFAVMMFMLGVNAAAANWVTLPNPYNLSNSFANFLPVIFSSSTESYLFVPGTSFVKESSSDSTEWIFIKKSAQIFSGKSTGQKVIYIPIPIAGVIDGQRVRVTELTVFYKCSQGEFTYIDKTLLTKYTEETTLHSLAKDDTNRTSNT